MTSVWSPLANDLVQFCQNLLVAGKHGLSPIGLDQTTGFNLQVTALLTPDRVSYAVKPRIDADNLM